MNLNSTDIERFTAQYVDPNVSMEDLVRIWGHSSGTLYRWGFELNIKRPRQVGQVQLALAQVKRYCEQISAELPPLPAIDIVTMPLGRGAKMDMVLLLSDGHAGRMTSSFNTVVYANRMIALARRIADEVDLLRKRYRIAKLHLLAIGDSVTGEKVGHNIFLEELEHTIMTQIYGVCIPRFVQFSNFMLRIFKDVEVTTVRGNHGALARPSPSKANWDSVAYLGWQAMMSAQKRISFDIEPVNWCNYVTIQGVSHLIVHGDSISAAGGNPYNSIAAKVQRWHHVLPRPFHYLFAGHFHHFAMLQGVFMNASLLTDDNWAREVLGKAGDCGQLLLGFVNGKVEYIKPIWLDDVGEDDA